MSLGALALMLRKKAIRFSRLDKVDDVREARSSDLGELGRLFFVSCWSSSDEENIGLWSLYTPNMAGVRIKLPSKMFEEFTIDPQHIGNLHITTPIVSPLPLDKMLTDEYLIHPTVYNPSQFLIEVEYMDDESKLCPTIRAGDIQRNLYSLGNFAKYKRPEWRFQSEWRFRMLIIPGQFTSYISHPGIADIFAAMLSSGIENGSLMFDEFYLDLDDNVLNNIEVVLGPKTNEGDKALVEALLSKYCSNPSLKPSHLELR